MAGVLNLARATPDAARRRMILEGGRALYVQALSRQP
jgi:hypothetical protein